MATEVYLIRHGETAWSLSHQHTGSTDLPLTENGEDQARRVGLLIHGIAFAQVLVSPLRRARRTCELAGLDPVAQITLDLREWDYGDYEGLTPAEVRARRPGWNVYRDGCPGGESAAQVAVRADRIVAALRAMQGRIAVFSHGQFLRALAARWIELPMEMGYHFGLDTGSLSVLGHEHNNVDAPAISLWNAVSNDLFALTPRAGA